MTGAASSLPPSSTPSLPAFPKKRKQQQCDLTAAMVDESPKTKSIHILVVPFPGQGHILPLLDLLHLLSARYRIVATVAVTPETLPSLSRCPSAVTPLVLPFPEKLQQGLENVKDELGGTRSATFYLPTQLTMATLAGLHGPLVQWARSHPDPPSAVLSDFFCGWTYRLADELGVPRILFYPSGSFTITISHFLWQRMPQRSNPDDPNELVAFPSVPNSPFFAWSELTPLYTWHQQGDPINEFIKQGYMDNFRSWGVVFNTFSDFEGPYLDHLRAAFCHSHVWAVGPLSAAARVESGSTERGRPSSIAAEEVTAWLDGCEEGTVVYVAFGSRVVLSVELAAALAAGLERSGARFIWAAMEGTPIPEGFEEQVASRGLVIRGWAPQLVILKHAAVGSFVTHCGWNSVLEAVEAGVALLMWPMKADQFFNARLIADEVGIGVKVCGGESAPDPDELARAVAESVGELGKERREKVKAIRQKALEAIAADGSSYKDLEDLVKELSLSTHNHKL